MGGLFQRGYENQLQQFPVLGDIPILGTLFRSARWKRSETELVIIVTPRVATPADFTRAAQLNSLSGAEPAAKDLIFKGQSLDKPMTEDRGASK